MRYLQFRGVTESAKEGTARLDDAVQLARQLLGGLARRDVTPPVLQQVQNELQVLPTQLRGQLGCKVFIVF